MSFLPTKSLFIGSSGPPRQVFHWQQSNLCSQLIPCPTLWPLEAWNSYLHTFLPCTLLPSSASLCHSTFFLLWFPICPTVLAGCGVLTASTKNEAVIYSKSPLSLGTNSFILCYQDYTGGGHTHHSSSLSIPNSHFLQFSGHVYVSHGVGSKDEWKW